MQFYPPFTQLSVDNNTKTHISLHNQFSFGSRKWVGYYRESFFPKSNGAGVMVFAMQSRDFGWGVQLTEDQLKQGNANKE